MASDSNRLLVEKRKVGKVFLHGSFRGLTCGIAGVICLVACELLCAFPGTAVAQTPQASTLQENHQPDPIAEKSAASQQPNPQASGSISGTVVDKSGAVAVGAQVQLTQAGQSRTVSSGDNGEFSFSDVLPGSFQLTITAPGFETKVFSGVLHPGEAYIVPAIALSIARATTNVRVGGSTEEVAEVEIKEEEKQRVLGIIPNFYVTYLPNPAPLSAKQKFELAWKSVIDPTTFLGVGVLAGVEQAADQYGAYGQGAAGYGRRFGAAYGDVFIGTFLDSAILPALMKQDPRYFYQGTGSTRSRLLHALSNAVIRKGDNGRWQPDYSAIIGSFADGAISYSYYPPADRSPSLLVENALISIAGGGVAGVFQEFVLRKFTTHSKNQAAPHP